MKLKKNELANTGLICGSLEICLEKGFNCTDCPHIPNNKRIYDPYTGEKIKREKAEDMSAEEYQRKKRVWEHYNKQEGETEWLIWRGKGHIIKGYDKGEISICLKESIDSSQEDAAEYKIVLLKKKNKEEEYKNEGHRPFCDDEKTEKLLMNTRVLYGLSQQGHIPTIERMIKRGATWEEIGKEIGWDVATAKKHYGWYIEKKRV